MTSKQVCTALVALLMVGTTAHAGISAKSANSPRAAKAAADANKVIEEARREYIAKNGNVNAMSHKTKAAFLLAMKSYSDRVPGLSSNSLMRLVLAPELKSLEGKDILAQLDALSQVKANGTKEQKEAADLQIELYELAGIRLTAKNMNSKEMEALRVLLSIDLQAIPQAIPVVGRIVNNLRKGETAMTFEKSVTDGMQGMKGTLEQFINLCSKA